MSMRVLAVGLALSLAAVGCDSAKRAQARADSIIADSLLQVVRAQAAAATADSVRRADSVTAAQAAAKAKAVAPKPRSGGTKTTIIGRDSVNTKPKVIGLPVVGDTAKRRPPR